jgi:two-component system response regulator HydG
LGDLLASDGFTVELASTGSTALETATRSQFDVVICSSNLEGMSDMQLLDRLHGLHPPPPVIVTADNPAITDAVAAIKHGAFQFVSGESLSTTLRGLVQEATHDHRRPVSQRATSLGATSELVAASPAMQSLLESVALVAQSSAPVLIQGESGTGKERIARAIHARGPRKNRSFVAVNAAAIPEQLLESEMFGHVRGAFTGATQTRRGVFDEADGGTVLLDEIGDMPFALQAKLLRVLQFGEVRPVGGERTHTVDVRVIAATHRNLDVLVNENKFRDDLRYRLNVLTLDLPPLRMRREDIPPLALHFLERAAARTPTSPVRGIDDAAMEVLRNAPWPGNVRELESAIERLVVLSREEMITPRHLGFIGADSVSEPWGVDRHRLMTLREMNQSYLAWVLRQTDGDKARAARILDIDLSTLYRWQRANR